MFNASSFYLHSNPKTLLLQSFSFVLLNFSYDISLLVQYCTAFLVVHIHSSFQVLKTQLFHGLSSWNRFVGCNMNSRHITFTTVCHVQVPIHHPFLLHSPLILTTHHIILSSSLLLRIIHTPFSPILLHTFFPCAWCIYIVMSNMAVIDFEMTLLSRER